MTLGPLEYTVIGFEGNRFNGEIANEIERVVENGSVRLVDVLFITKNFDGDVTIVEVDNKDDLRFIAEASWDLDAPAMTMAGQRSGHLPVLDPKDGRSTLPL